MTNKELLTKLNEVFPVQAAVVPYIELRYRYGPQFGVEDLESTLKALVDEGILLRYEFNDSVQYKLLTEFLPLDAKSPKSTGKVESTVNVQSPGNGQLDDLSKLVIQISKQIDNKTLEVLIDDFRQKYGY
jgi:hypothetical protein